MPDEQTQSDPHVENSGHVEASDFVEATPAAKPPVTVDRDDVPEATPNMDVPRTPGLLPERDIVRRALALPPGERLLWAPSPKLGVTIEADITIPMPDAVTKLNAVHRFPAVVLQFHPTTEPFRIMVRTTSDHEVADDLYLSCGIVDFDLWFDQHMPTVRPQLRALSAKDLNRERTDWWNRLCRMSGLGRRFGTRFDIPGLIWPIASKDPKGADFRIVRSVNLIREREERALLARAEAKKAKKKGKAA